MPFRDAFATRGPISTGTAAGLAATAAMTAFMKGWQRVVPPEQDRPLPPRQVTKGLTSKAGLWQRLPPPARTALTWASHFGFGAAVAVGYAGLERRVPGPRIVSGALYGLGVWAASYAGWLPALNVFPPPQDQPSERNTLLVAAHLVWGATLGLTTAALEKEA